MNTISSYYLEVKQNGVKKTQCLMLEEVLPLLPQASNDLPDCLLGGAVVVYPNTPFVVGSQVLQTFIYDLHVIHGQFLLACEDGFGFYPNQEVPLAGWHKMPQPTEELVAQKDAAAFGIHDDVREISVEEDDVLPLAQRHDFQPVADDIVAHVVPQAHQRTDHSATFRTMWHIEVPVNLLLKTCLVPDFAKIWK